MTAGFNKNQDRTCFGLVFFTKQITAPPQLSKGWSRMKVDDLSLWMGVESNYCLPALGAFTIRRSQAALHSGHAPGGGGADEGRGVRRLHIVHSCSKWLKAAKNKFGWVISRISSNWFWKIYTISISGGCICFTLKICQTDDQLISNIFGCDFTNYFKLISANSSSNSKFVKLLQSYVAPVNFTNFSICNFWRVFCYLVLLNYWYFYSAGLLLQREHSSLSSTASRIVRSSFWDCTGAHKAISSFWRNFCPRLICLTRFF